MAILRRTVGCHLPKTKKNNREETNSLVCWCASLVTSPHFQRRPRIQIEGGQRDLKFLPDRRGNAHSSSQSFPKSPYHLTWAEYALSGEVRERHKFKNVSTNKTSHRKEFLRSMPPLCTVLPGSSKRLKSRYWTCQNTTYQYDVCITILTNYV